MDLSRRNFLQSVGIGAGAAALGSLPIESAFAWAEPRRASHPDGPILLNSNENAYGPPEKVKLAMQGALSLANRYPDHQYDELVSRIAKLHDVKLPQVLVGCGSTEILRVSADAFLAPGKKLLQAAPTFEALSWYARSRGAETVSVPLTASFAHNLEAMLAQVDSSTGLVYICNPNNPTASLTPRNDLDAFLRKLPAGVMVLMDEAYHHFAGDSPDYASYLDKKLDDPRIIVARTFSKIYGMAGIRLGYAVAAQETIQRMRPYQLQDNVNQVAARAGVAGLDDAATIRADIARNAADRKEFFAQAAARMLEPIPSFTNFAMMNASRPVTEVIAHFKKNNILVGRRFPAMESYVRVSLGTPAQMREFWRAWDMLPKAGNS